MSSELLPLVFLPLPLGEIRPAGWLRDQLRIQAEGLTGHLDEFWPDVRDSAWIGGAGEGWERGPYWLDGVIPLAFLLDDKKLLAKARRWIDYILTHQQPDGWLGPARDRGATPRDPWPVFVALKALTQWADATGDERVIPAMQRFFRRLEVELDRQPLSSWARFRWGDLLLSIFWLHDRAPDASLLELANKVHDQGFDWRGLFDRYPHQHKSVFGKDQDGCTSTHGVNNAMAIKTPALWYRKSKVAGDLESSFDMMRVLDEFHGQVTGVFSCDEHLAGKDPSQGTELCTVVEYQFSLEVLLSVLGHGLLADRLERITFNALPATFSEDMWAHQYDQQVNQIICRREGEHVYTSNGPDANLFGLEPHFGCCTANMHQGWPKFAASLWMKTREGGLAAISYCPCEVETQVESGPVRIRVEGSYPFHSARIIVETGRPTWFALLLRVPGWANNARVRVGDERFLHMIPDNGFHRLERDWQGTTEIELSFGKRFEIERRYNRSISIVRGPLVMALSIGEQWRKADAAKDTNWEVLPTTAWNYGICLDEQLMQRLGEIEAGPVERHPFSSKTPPLRLTLPARRVPQWAMEKNAAGPMPMSPVSVEHGVEEVTLVPYGCTHLRLAEFPVVETEPRRE